MMVSNQGSFLRVLAWQWKASLMFLGCGLAVWLAHDVIGVQQAKLPGGPAAIVGAALGIFAAFRVNAAYARWWEGRQLWGRLVNSSRMFATQLGAYVDNPELVRRLVTRHALYVHILRCQLRDDDPWADEHVQRLAGKLGIGDDERAHLKAQTSVCHALVDRSLKELAAGKLEPLRMQSLDATLYTFLDVQGGCERIKRTPMPRSYGFFVSRLLLIFGALFPLSIVNELGWVVIPLNLVVCIGFLLISETGRVLEDPFTHFWNSLPLTNMSVNIERNTRQRLGDDDLPAATVVDKQGILW